ncbi:hypothetical protein CNMCM5793_007450 [Aspergillus hiratsukae]|uniref:Uncharacterized protein n=1 Tax=Aspergillus hiratsukae TaxID=1194566 RepID=A0A8H6PHE5_9EURO|nr:hypothetical protein CNMCM5793_007450 [Aspergillus hiratsukae]KAF7158824.1 hypothetical protein CNMCM6106_005699 [Aspergillus hiratsukae]
MTVIDLTLDSDSEDQRRLAAQRQSLKGPQQSPKTFFSNLTHRTPSSSIPLKRKDRSSGSPSLAVPKANHLNHNNIHHAGNSLGLDNHSNPITSSNTTNNAVTNANTLNSNHVFTPKIQNPSTPSPSPSSQQEAIGVVILSPSRQLKKQIEQSDWVKPPPFTPEKTALSTEYYPIDAHEKRALKGAYPSARKVKRSEIPFSIGKPGPILENRIPVQRQLLETLQRKLSNIRGPAVTFAPGEEGLLADFASNFEFVNAYIKRKGVSHIPAEFNFGCDCNTICDPARCSCLEKDDETKEIIVPYQRAQNNARLLVLTPEFLKRTDIIIECNSECKCDAQRCWNRVVQHGRTIRLEIFHTGNRGFGLRSPDWIRAGQFIDCYLGEVITKREADVREEVATSQHGHSYLFGLDFFHDDDQMNVVDGQKFGAPTRFMNHSCNPNCKMFPVSRTPGDDRLYDLAFFALREIPPNTELTFDYNPNWEEDKNNKVDPNAVRCLCGEKNCRGQLWPNERKGTK